MRLDDDAREAWAVFLRTSEIHAHLEKPPEDQIDTYVQECFQSAIETSSRVSGNLPGHNPTRILEVGSSAGMICFGLQAKYPSAEVVGIEPAIQAVYTANLTARAQGSPRPHFIRGVGERLPFPDGSIDLIVCHTVIEHVREVKLVISEMARVLSQSGAIHLEAPNYVWPHEPHLQVWCIPLLGKWSVRLCAKLQGKGKHLRYLDHLQFVTPAQLESEFARNGLNWENLVRKKLDRVLGGDASQIKAYSRVASLLSKLSNTGLKKLIINSVLMAQCYPSVLYTARKAH